jgi:hypothetical protein
LHRPLLFFFYVESVGLCSGNDTTNSKSLLLITFGFGPNQYSQKKPGDFNFSTKNHKQKLQSKINKGEFGFVNAVPNIHNTWHTGALDRTMDEVNGYMYLVDIAAAGGQLFKSTVNDLCIGVRYEFSAYLANIIQKKHPSIKPNIRFEVQTTTGQKYLVAQLSTQDIPAFSKMTWKKYGLSFAASNHSVVLLMIAEPKGGGGNDLAIDDIQFRVCSTADSSVCPPGLHISYSLNMR